MMHDLFKHFSYAILAVTTLWITGCNTGPTFHTLQGAVWNTTYNIKYSGERNLDDSIMTVMNNIELSLSPFNHNSLIARINSNISMKADSNIIKVLEISHKVNRLSDRAFDPTISPLVNLWGFGYEGHEAKVPTDSDIASALTLVGIDSCHIDRDMIMHKKSPGTTFNFSAVTKGYACDEIGRMLRRNGSTDYMIEIGGELTLGGSNDKGVPWRIMIDAPVENTHRHQRLMTIQLSNCGIATSGNYRNYHDTGNHGRVGHTISPSTGYPVTTGTLSATVIAPDCATADALATACMAMRADSALSMIEKYSNTHCMLVIGHPDSMTLVSTPLFPADNVQ